MANPEFDYNNSGRLSLGGVIINTYNRIQLHDMTKFQYVKNRDKSILIMDEKCSLNIFINTFINACNIKMDCSYSTEEELNTLSYKYIIIATDQDKDGWNINGLLLVFLMKWPNLVSSGRIMRMQTPIARLKPTKIKGDNYKNSIEFFTETEVENYLKKNNVPNGKEIKYYKGLASHEPEFRNEIFRNARKYLYTFQVTPKSIELLGVYYNKLNPDMRKDELKTPLRDFYPIEKKYYREKKIYISTFLQIYVKDYQLDNLNRKLLKVLDGQNNVCGKLLHVAPQIYKKYNETRVSYLGSEVAKRTNYHHGENSMYETIFKNSQTFTGKKMYPIYHGLGEFGSRSDGGKKHGAPRYTYLTLNTQFHSAMFRKEDNILLEYCRSEAVVIEPKYYFPILPLAIMENYKTTAHGWKIEIFGCDSKKRSPA
jgi:DNA topoisomerase-2